MTRLTSGVIKSKLGTIPATWKIAKFKHITSILRCGIASTPKYVEEGIPFLSSQNVKPNKLVLHRYKYISEADHRELTKKHKPQKGDILYTRVGNIGEAALVDVDFEFSVYVSLTHIRMKEGYDSLFYTYLLNSDYYVHKAKQMVFRGGGVSNLNVKQVEDFDMLVPPLYEQKKIADILATWDTAIALKQKLIEQQRERHRGLMQQLLSGAVRLPGFSAAWEEVRLADLGKTYNGLSGKKADDFGTGKPYIPYKTVFHDGKIDLQAVDYVSIGENEKQNKVKYGDIFFTTSSETPFEVGMSSVLLTEVQEMYLNSFCFGFRLHNFDRLLPEFARFLFRSDAVRKQMYRLAQGSTRFNISKAEVIKLKVKLPTLEEQRRITDVLHRSHSVVKLLEQQVNALEQQKKGLMQLLLTGKVRVAEAEAAVTV